MTSGKPTSAANYPPSSSDSHTPTLATHSPTHCATSLNPQRPQNGSSVPGLFHEPVVEVLVVLGARAVLWVVLDGEDRQGAMAQAFARPVVQIALRDEEVSGWDRCRVDLELVVLARDVHAARLEILHRVVGAVVAERQARRARPGGSTQDLVAQADAEDRDSADRLARY